MWILSAVLHLPPKVGDTLVNFQLHFSVICAKVGVHLPLDML